MTIIEALVQLRNDLKLWVTNNLRTKVDKVDGKGLSSNDFTTEEKEKLAALDPDATAITVDAELSSTSENPVQNKAVNTAISNLNTLVGDKAVSEQITTAINEIDYPIDSVNGKTGAVVLTASDVGALPSSTIIPSIDGLATKDYVTDVIAGAAYTLPTATSDVLGGVKVGSGLKTNNGVLSVDVIDNLTSTSTTQPLSAAQGKMLNEAINSITTDLGNLGGGDMMKATYDKNGDGVVDNAAQLEGHSASYFATATGLSNLSGLVGDTAVSTQITNAINGITPPVSSVNGKTGAVTLSASDVGALPSTTTIPSIAGLATEEFVTNKIAEASLSGQVDLSGYATISYVDSKTVVDSAMSTTSTNPVQNKVVNAAIAGNLVSAKNYTDSEITEWVGDTTVAEQISTAIASKSDSGHTHDDRYYTESEIDTKLSGKANSSHGNHVPETQTADNSKFLRNDNTWQVVTPANIGAAAANHGTHVSYSTTDPVMDGSASAGSAATVARSDHKHPTDTSRAAASELTALKGLVGDTAVSAQISNAIAGKANSSDLTSHTGNKSNPHGVTIEQIGAAPQYTYGTSDLTAGTSTLTTGTLYFVYE